MEQMTLKFLTIREVARTGILSEHHLRLMEKEGRLPGIRTGRTFRVNYGMLIEQLNADSRREATAQVGQIRPGTAQ